MTAVLILSLLSPTRMAVELELDHQQRLGVFPAGATSVTGTTYDLSLNPSLQAGVRTPKSRWTAQYRPQFTWIPNLEDVFVLHHADVGGGGEITKGWDAFAFAAIDAGQVDISRELALRDARLNPGAPLPDLTTLAQSRIVNYRQLSGAAQTQVEITNDWSVVASLNGSETEPNLDEGEQSILLEQSVSSELAMQFNLTRDDTLQVTFATNTTLYEDTLSYRSMTPSVQYNRQLGRRFSLLLRGGTLLANQATTLDLRFWKIDTSRDALIMILASDVQLSGRLFRVPYIQALGAVRVSTLPFYDPFRGTLDARMSVGGNIQLELGRLSNLELSADVFAPAKFAFLQGEDNQVPFSAAASPNDASNVGVGAEFRTYMNHFLTFVAQVQLNFLIGGSGVNTNNQSIFASAGVIARWPLLDSGNDRRAIQTRD